MPSMNCQKAKCLLSSTSPRSAQPSLVLGALGVVFGDIGTSPLYALQAGLTAGMGGGQEREAVVFGVLSLITWALILVVSLKYILFILRADNSGEGGILALVTLLKPKRARDPLTIALLVCGLVGAAMLFGDGVLTPAISVLSAIEGLEVVAPSIGEWVIPIAVAVLLLIFWMQRKGVGPIAKFYGPVMVIWFAAIGLCGLLKIIEAPAVLYAVNPVYGVELLAAEPSQALLILGAVFLAVTGGEALYADLGQFGRRVIRRAWFAIALPGLLLNYYGQGALYLETVDVKRSFFQIVPDGFGTAMVILATAATIIASQAILTGAFSLTRQAIELGFLPPMHTRYTSEENESDIYIGRVNWLIAIATIAVVINFGSSAALAGAYGIAVAITMVTTTILFGALMWRSWNVPKPAIVALLVVFFVVDIPFAVANFSKLLDGGYLPLFFGGLVLLVMRAWRRGIDQLRENHLAGDVPLATLASKDFTGQRLQQTAVFLTRSSGLTPLALLRMRKLADLTFKPTIVCAVRTVGRPRVPKDDRYRFTDLGNDIVKIELFFGYMQTVNLPSVLVPILRDHQIDCEDILYFVGTDRVITEGESSGPGNLMNRLFAFLVDTAERPTDRYYLPETRTIAFGAGRRL